MGDALLGAGLGLGAGALLGGKDGGDDASARALRNLAASTSGASTDLLNSTALTRRLVLAPIESALLGVRPTVLPAFRPARETIERQFSNARENVISRAPVRGGQLNQALIGLESDRARAIGDLDADLTGKLFQTGAQVGFQVPGVAFGGMNSAASGFANLAQQASAQETGKGAGIGGLAGNLIIASALKK